MNQALILSLARTLPCHMYYLPSASNNRSCTLLPGATGQQGIQGVQGNQGGTGATGAGGQTGDEASLYSLIDSNYHHVYCLPLPLLIVHVPCYQVPPDSKAFKGCKATRE